MSRRPLVALADPEWIGHRETYFREFTLSLQRVGADVLGLCPEPARLESSIPNSSSGALLATATLTEPRRLPVLSRLPHDPINTRSRWQRLSAALRRAEESTGRDADFLFLPWLDSYLRASVHPQFSLSGLSVPWAGLYFRPHHLVSNGGTTPAHSSLLSNLAKGDSLLRAPSCKAVATLDETLRPVLEATSGKPIVLFPDITNETPPDDTTPFAQRIRDKANGRKVIGLIGMEPRKGVITMLKTADIARTEGKPWLFVLAGTSCLPLYSDEERRFIESQIDKSRTDPESNLLFPDEFGPVPDGPVFNGVMDSFDALFIAYHDFLGSSNVLTKAALLKKPVVCTDLGCIASRTVGFGLGLAIPQGDARACGKALERVLAGVDWNDKPLKPRYEEYHSEHNRTRLDASMKQLISLIPTASA